MAPKNKKQRNDPAYIREQGNRKAKGKNRRLVTFCFNKHIKNQGQTFKEWENLGLLSKLIERTKHIGQFSCQEAIQNGCIKQYTNVSFPPDSQFKKPNHIYDVIWCSIHVTPQSKEVVVGYLENDIFYLVFLDKDHLFWPSKLKNT